MHHITSALFLVTTALSLLACGSDSGGNGPNDDGKNDAKDTVVVYQCLSAAGWVDLCTVNLDGSNKQALTTDGSEAASYSLPSATPDGKKLSFSLQGKLYVLDVVAGTTIGPMANSAALLASQISPNGNDVLTYYVLNQSSTLYAYVQTWSSAGPTTQSATNRLGRVLSDGFSIGWGPAGSGILFTDRHDTTRLNEICIATGSDTTCSRVVATDATAGLELPAISPNGKLLAVVANADNSYLGHIRIYDYATGNLVRDLTNGAYDTNPVWSPDSSTIVFERRNAAGTESDLYKIASTGSPGSEKLLVADGIQPTVATDISSD